MRRYYLWKSARIRLTAILSTDETLRNLGTSAFVTSHLLSEGRSHLSAAVELLRLIGRMEELHTKVQGMITPPHLYTTLLYYVSHQWSLYLNRCVSASALEALESPGATVPFTLDPILIKLESRRYVGTIILGVIADILVGRRNDDTRGNDDSSSGGGGGKGSGAGRSGDKAGRKGVGAL